MGQVGIYSASLLGMHNHLNDSQGGLLNEYSRDGAYRTPYRTGALAVSTQSPLEKISTSLVWAKIKQIRVNKAYPGQFVMSWTMRNLLGAHDVHSRFYVNDAPIGADEADDSAIPVTKIHNYDVALAAGDLLQIWGYRADVGDEVAIEMFEIKYDWGIKYFGDGTRNNLATILLLVDTDVLDITIQDP